MKKEVSEKTLELNVTAEVLRSVWKTAPKAFWIGMKQDEENANGLDELLRKGGVHHYMFQFKSPAAGGSADRFTINSTQTGLLLRLAALYPDAVYYVFPCFNTLSDVESKAGNLSADTWLLRVAGLSSWHRKGKAQQKHRVNLSKRPTARLFSKGDDHELIKLEEFLATRDRQHRGIPTRGLVAWLREEVQLTRRETGQFFRGMGSLCF